MISLLAAPGRANIRGYRSRKELGEHGVSRHCGQPDAGSAQVAKICRATINPASAVSPASNAPASFHVSAFIAA